MTAKTRLLVKKGVLLQDIRRMIEKTRSAVAAAVDACWKLYTETSMSCMKKGY